MGNAASIGRELRAHLSKTMSDMMLKAADAVTNATPIKTSHAESNWILSVRSPYSRVDGSPRAVSHAAQDAGIQLIQRYDIGKHGPKIFLRNNVLYVQFLDKNSRHAGFVAKALQSAARVARGRVQSARRVLRSMARSAYRQGF